MPSDGKVMDEDLVYRIDMKVEVMVAMEIMAHGNVQSTEKLWINCLKSAMHSYCHIFFLFLVYF